MQVNDVIHGFKVINIRHAEEIKADMIEMIHEKTQAKTIWLKRNDENNYRKRKGQKARQP